MNYNTELLKLLKKLTYRPKLLLHSCCGPCSSYVISFLNEYFDITIFYYNPSIEPSCEYYKRKEEQLKFIKSYKTSNKVNFLECDYDNHLFKELSLNLESEPEGGKRCVKCFYQRLEKTRDEADLNSFEYFGTTLTVSPHKDADIINNIGMQLENKSKYLISDFKKNDGYKKSIELSKKYDLYRQEYCGCLFSKNAKKTVADTE